MADQQHLAILQQGIDAWNKWRQEHSEIRPDLSKANLKEADLEGINFAEANLARINLSYANLAGAILIEANLARANLREAYLNSAFLEKANLKGANLNEADLNDAHLTKANLSKAHLVATDLNGADLRDADLSGADLSLAFLYGAYLNRANLNRANLSGAALTRADLNGANLSEALLLNALLVDAHLRETNLCFADLSKANLSGATLIGTKALDANLTGCRVHGISTWDIQLEGAEQSELIITPEEQPIITVDDLEAAQFIYLILNNQKIRSVIDTITSKAVLILGRFTRDRKIVLDRLREALRQQNYLPILFDFEKPDSRDLTETVSTLAHLARFIIVDLTDPSSAPHEVATVIPQCIVPVQPLLFLEEKKREYSMFQDLRRRYDWVLPTYHYTDLNDLLASLQEKVITPAEEKAKELERQKAV